MEDEEAGKEIEEQPGAGERPRREDASVRAGRGHVQEGGASGCRESASSAGVRSGLERVAQTSRIMQARTLRWGCWGRQQLRNGRASLGHGPLSLLETLLWEQRVAVCCGCGLALCHPDL